MYRGRFTRLLFSMCIAYYISFDLSTSSQIPDSALCTRATGTKIQDSRVLGILVLGSWFHGRGCIEVQFFNAGFNAMRPGSENQKPRVLGFLVLGSRFHEPGCIEVQLFNAGFNAGIR